METWKTDFEPIEVPGFRYVCDSVRYRLRANGFETEAL
jgi:hypothetical protein